MQNNVSRQARAERRCEGSVLLIEADIEMHKRGDDERLIYRVFNGKVKVISKDVARTIVWWCYR